MKTLNQLATGQIAQITHIDAANQTAQRLMAMGVLPGSTVEIVQVAPLGDPMNISIAGRRLSLRKADAQCIQIK